MVLSLGCILESLEEKKKKSSLPEAHYVDKGSNSIDLGETERSVMF